MSSWALINPCFSHSLCNVCSFSMPEYYLLDLESNKQWLSLCCLFIEEEAVSLGSHFSRLVNHESSRRRQRGIWALSNFGQQMTPNYWWNEAEQLLFTFESVQRHRWWQVTKYIYSSILIMYNFKVMVLYLNMRHCLTAGVTVTYNIKD